MSACVVCWLSTCLDPANLLACLCAAFPEDAATKVILPGSPDYKQASMWVRRAASKQRPASSRGLHLHAMFRQEQGSEQQQAAV